MRRIPLFVDTKFFPRVLRSHGITHSPFTTRRKRQPRCVQHGCRGGAEHDGQYENVCDWKEDHGLPSDRQNKQRANARKAHEKELRTRGTYVPAPRIPQAPALKTRTRCESCGRHSESGLELGLCAICWRVGHTFVPDDLAESDLNASAPAA